MEKNDKDKDNKIQYMPIGMCLGLSIGMAIGAAMDNISVGMCMGLGIGLCFGSAIDAYNRKKSDSDSQDETDTEQSAQ